RVLFVYRNAEWLGIEYLSAVLKQAGHQTDLVFDPGIGDIEFKFEFLDRLLPIEKRMVERAVRFAPDLIAVSCVTNLYPWAKRMMHLLKRATGRPIVIGGIHPTITPETVIQNPDVDYLIVGEGEEALLDLANSLERGDERTDIPNVWFKRGDEVINNEIRPYTEDLDKYPFPDKEIFRQYGCFTSRIYVMTARGCPYHCTYCFNDRQQELYEGKGTYVRRRSVQNVMDELKYFRARYPIKEVFFYDDIFTIQKAWLREFAERYPREVGLPYKCLVRPDCLDGEMVDILKRTNCIYVDMGVEAGSPEVRARLDRAMDDETILAAGRRLKQAGIKFCTLNILGSPGETAEEMMRTYDLNLKLEPEGVITTVMYPFPG
ncbi:MAG: B12-binding domain-containing radical SAM protein, partial [Candidatus Methylomirabilis sp.]|nr:B12-binding domain-containing radical SAM protein [Deltaproteobacteria bacterium]